MVPLLALVAAICTTVSASPKANTTTLNVPLTPPAGRTSDYLSSNLASFSIEFAFFTDFIGNKSHPNELTQRVLNNIQKRSGVPLSFRPGGITIDSSVYNANASALTRVTSSSGAIWRTVFGPGYFESINLLPKDTQFVVDLNFGNDSLPTALEEAKAHYAHMDPSSIWALELGNEPDHFSRPNWNAVTYTKEWVNWTTTIQSALNITTPHFVAVGSADDPPDALITTVKAVNAGIANGHTVEYVSQHTYQYSTCDPTRNARATLPNLINHENITTYLDLWKPQIAAAKSIGAPFLIGEFNSVSCSGKANVTDTFGQALWTVDTLLYAASINVTRLYIHQGATLVAQSATQLNTPGFSKYDMWIPQDTNTTGPAHVQPSYVGYLLLAEAVGKPTVPLSTYKTLKTGGTNTRIALLDTPAGYSIRTFAAYALYEHETPKRLVVINMAVRNVTMSTPVPANATLDISHLLTNNGATLKRMTSSGLDEKNASYVSWAGQTYADGRATGNEVIEKVGSSGVVEVRPSEAVLVFLN